MSPGPQLGGLGTVTSSFYDAPAKARDTGRARSRPPCESISRADSAARATRPSGHRRQRPGLRVKLMRANRFAQDPLRYPANGARSSPVACPVPEPMKFSLTRVEAS